MVITNSRYHTSRTSKTRTSDEGKKNLNGLEAFPLISMTTLSCFPKPIALKLESELEFPERLVVCGQPGPIPRIGFNIPEMGLEVLYF